MIVGLASLEIILCATLYSLHSTDYGIYNYTPCRWWSSGSHSDRWSGGRSPSADADTPAPVSGGGGGVCTEESSGEDHSRHSVAW